MKPLLRFDGVTCRRGGRLLFENLSFALGAGEALHLSGRNGSGKSSLLRVAAGLLRPEQGSIDRAHTALADHSPALDGELPLERALGFWIADPVRAMDRLGLLELTHVPVRHLSTGQLKRAGLARAACSRAPLWLLDEPMNGLDTGSLRLVESLIDQHRSAGGALIAASHVPLPGDWQRLELGA